MSYVPRWQSISGDALAAAGVAQQICSSQHALGWLSDAYYVKYHATLQVAFFEWKLLTTFTYPLSGTKYLDTFQ
jgi:hypothetical protein